MGASERGARAAVIAVCVRIYACVYLGKITQRELTNVSEHRAGLVEIWKIGARIGGLYRAVQYLHFDEGNLFCHR